MFEMDQDMDLYPRSAPALPPELIYMILEHHQAHRPTLFSSSLVSRLWRECASSYLFCRLQLPRHALPMNLRMVSWLFQSAPTISRSVRELLITSVHPAQHVTQDVLASILSQLPRLRVLVIHGLDSRSVLSSRAETFKPILKLQKLKLRVQHSLPLNDVLNTLELLVELNELCIEQRYVVGRPEPDRTPLVLAQIRPFPRHIRPRTLKLRPLPGDSSMLVFFAQQSILDDVEDLEVAFNTDEDVKIVGDWIDSPSSLNLRHLRLDVAAISNFKGNPDECMYLYLSSRA